MTATIEARVWIVDLRDNVGTVVGSDSPEGARLSIIGATKGAIQTLGTIAHGHKLALHAMTRGTDVVKYGVVIGRLTRDVRAGEHVHSHNMESLRGRGDLESDSTTR